MKWKQFFKICLFIKNTHVVLTYVALYRYDFFFFTKFSLVTQSCSTLCDLMNHSTPGLPVHHQLPESNQTHVH